MKQLILVLFAAVIAVSANAQEKKNLFKSIYEDLFEYSTIYLAGDIQNPKEQPKDYFVRTNPSGNIYEPPVVVDGTDYYDYDYLYDDYVDYDDYDDEYEGSGLYGGGHALKIQTSDQIGVGGHSHTGDPDYLNYNSLL